MDQVTPGVTGLLVPPGDVAALRQAICELVDHPERRARMGTAARRRFLARYEAERVIDEIEARYRSLVGRVTPV